MSFDVFFQGFADGDSRDGGGDRMRAELAPFTVAYDPEKEFTRISHGDGEADVYLDSDSMMANHINGTGPWDLLVKGARAADWVILPIGCPTCLTDEAQRSHLPEALADEVVLVISGAELLQVIQKG